MSRIHPSATIDPKAKIASDVEIGPNCCVGPDVTLSDGCRLYNNVTVVGRTTVGARNVFYPMCVIGAEPQDLKYGGEPTELVIGSDNVFRELVTAHTGTGAGGGVTRVGSHNRFLVGVHIAHDVVVEDNVIVSNGVQIGGHVHIESYATFGGMVGLHHFLTVGRYAFVAAMTRAPLDIPPFMIAQGPEGRVRGVNVQGMARWDFSQERIQALRTAYRDLFTDRSRYGSTLIQRLEGVESNGELTEDVRYLIEFIRRSTSEGRAGRYLESVRSEDTRKRAAFYAETSDGGAES